jgi:cobalt-zinc-cadmium efflux system membrane fusion protein
VVFRRTCSCAAVIALATAAWIISSACSGSAEPAKSAAPATVASPVKESDLTSVTLTPEAEKRLGIAIVPVERKPVTRNRLVGGEITAPSGAQIAITAPAAGTLQDGEIPRAGTVVSRGQTLFRLVPLQASERDARVDAEEALETARARQVAAAAKARRAEQLLKDGAGSRRAMEEAQAELAIAEAEVKAAAERVALASRSNATTGGVRIDAPDRAVVQAVHVTGGQTVAASAPLVDLVRIDTAWVRVPIYAGESADIDVSAPARVLRLGEPETSDGLLANPIPAPPSADATAAAVDLYYSFSNREQRFRPGERVSIRLPRRGRGEALVVPKAALLHDAYGGTWVYVATELRKFSRHRVIVVDVVGDLAILSRGPAQGTRVVTDGAAELFGTEFGTGK